VPSGFVGAADELAGGVEVGLLCGAFGVSFSAISFPDSWMLLVRIPDSVFRIQS
jgi:hypothetical protein